MFGRAESVGMVSKVTSLGVGLSRLAVVGWSNQAWTCPSRPFPSALFVLVVELVDAVAAVPLSGRWELLLGWDALRRSGSGEWVGHVCHGSPQAHRQSLTKRLFLHLLHQVLWPMACKLNAGLVPSIC